MIGFILSSRTVNCSKYLHVQCHVYKTHNVKIDKIISTHSVSNLRDDRWYYLQNAVERSKIFTPISTNNFHHGSTLKFRERSLSNFKRHFHIYQTLEISSLLHDERCLILACRKILSFHRIILQHSISRDYQRCRYVKVLLPCL